jgi:hypothetical protein
MAAGSGRLVAGKGGVEEIGRRRWLASAKPFARSGGEDTGLALYPRSHPAQVGGEGPPRNRNQQKSALLLQCSPLGKSLTSLKIRTVDLFIPLRKRGMIVEFKSLTYTYNPSRDPYGPCCFVGLFSVRLFSVRIVYYYDLIRVPKRQEI